AAFETLLEERRSRRRKQSDLHAAYAVLSDSTLRRTYDLSQMGRATSERLAEVKESAIEIAKDAIPEIQWSEVRKNAVQTVLQATVLVSGLTAKASDVAGSVSRRVQSAAVSKLS
ncbi:MAG: hypothetical protein PF636_05660, partial [Actinomycetota bacterium]|nr:hypothetical protein [Actinomycetota bacterium]